MGRPAHRGLGRLDAPPGREAAAGAVVPDMDTQGKAVPAADAEAALEVTRALLRHTFAIIAYRTAKCLSGAPAEFGTFAPGAGVRTPAEVVNHLTGLCRFAQGLLTGGPRRQDAPIPWPEEVRRLEAAMRELDGAVAVAAEWHHEPTEALQGPLADALTHVGQLALLRRLAGTPVPAENYSRAPIRVGDLRLDRD